MKKKITFCFDIDNTICKTSLSKYNSSKPDKNAIEMINKLYEKGHIIKINTARNMGRNKDDIKKSNEIILGKVNKSVSEVHDELTRLDKSISLKAVRRDYICWQQPNWPSKVEYQIVTRVRNKIFYVQLGAEQASGKFVAVKLKDLLPVFKSKFPDHKWQYDKWYSDYDNRIFTIIDIGDPKKAAELYLK